MVKQATFCSVYYIQCQQVFSTVCSISICFNPLCLAWYDALLIPHPLYRPGLFLLHRLSLLHPVTLAVPVVCPASEEDTHLYTYIPQFAFYAHFTTLSPIFFLLVPTPISHPHTCTNSPAPLLQLLFQKQSPGLDNFTN